MKTIVFAVLIAAAVAAPTSDESPKPKRGLLGALALPHAAPLALPAAPLALHAPALSLAHAAPALSLAHAAPILHAPLPAFHAAPLHAFHAAPALSLAHAAPALSLAHAAPLALHAPLALGHSFGHPIW